MALRYTFAVGVVVGFALFLHQHGLTWTGVCSWMVGGMISAAYQMAREG